MDRQEIFWNSVKNEEIMFLATAADDSVSMRTVAPVHYDDAVLIFTGPPSRKYAQLKKNPNCCFSLTGCFVEAKAEFMGPTLSESNAKLREAYEKKFKGAFDEDAEYNGRNSEFILLRPIVMKGWGMENGTYTLPFEHRF
jgi:Pyridoxamine 5''-phosphate oxidase.